MGQTAGNQLLKGHLHTLVLHLLAEKGRMYGYEITREVKERTQGQVLLTEGALYPVLHKLESQGGSPKQNWPTAEHASITA